MQKDTCNQTETCIVGNPGLAFVVVVVCMKEKKCILEQKRMFVKFRSFILTTLKKQKVHNLQPFCTSA